eukprot:12414893-Alexandrium_andersonii.AAC.1
MALCVDGVRELSEHFLISDASPAPRVCQVKGRSDAGSASSCLATPPAALPSLGLGALPAPRIASSMRVA